MINEPKEDFKKQAIIIANHTSFLDIIAIGMLHPKIIFLVNDWVYNSPVFGKAIQLAGFYPVSSGIENGLEHLKKKVEQGYTLMAFPEGTRSKTHKIKRFHKGAFYLAEQFNLDIIPVLIHGNSEVIPKGESMIRDGHITLKILDRITPEDSRFSNNYSQRAKQIGAYFRTEFSAFRKEREGATYFHNILLDEYRYKGDTLYQNVKKDITTHKDIYKMVLNTVGKKSTIVHLSDDVGQLDFLLALDAVDRKIISYIENTEYRTLVKNSFIPNSRNITFADSIEATLPFKANALIISATNITEAQLKLMIQSDLNHLIFLKESKHLLATNTLDLGFDCTYQTENMTILSKQLK
ncbi:membrane protein, inferred for ABFAE pathway [Winogradskyella psychrotolerans RS-3]|uniref:Membrane protein, inferred for ABFAE pathway n=1 Tax=Winogradskyella psychrotolerans RS-3 TaxID=641526 RepID=S7VJ54_9FLAO|nr:1-acyl-sn-glycerol-3-phosphate acyltransferase [Winogradskyella psychrotolerans]EPR70011.1 membrane protein, inferred for ABFAE pathway [Winogradskyella psychrotolerans RS-3]